MGEKTFAKTLLRITNTLYVAVLVYILYEIMMLPRLELVAYALVSIVSIIYLSEKIGDRIFEIWQGRPV